MTLSKAIYAVTRRIPKSKVATYGDLAYAVGRPRAWRHIGTVMSRNRDPQIPCHRVVRSDGKVGGFGYPGGTLEKIKRLQKEGIVVNNSKINLRRFRIKRLETRD